MGRRLEYEVKTSVRLNMNNPQHVRINNVIQNLDPKIFKSKNQFIIDACKFYIDHYGEEEFIHDFAKKSEYCIVGKMRRNGFSQRDVDRQWMQIVNMIRKKQIKGVVVANMAAVSSSVADAYYKVGLINEAGGVVVTVDEGRLEMKIKEVS